MASFSTSTEPLSVSFRGINKSYTAGGPLVLRDLDLDIEAGELLTVLGPSGCGQTSLVSRTRIPVTCWSEVTQSCPRQRRKEIWEWSFNPIPYFPTCRSPKTSNTDCASANAIKQLRVNAARSY